MYAFSKNGIKQVDDKYIIDCESKGFQSFDCLVGTSFVMDFKTYIINEISDISGNRCKLVCTIQD